MSWRSDDERVNSSPSINAFWEDAYRKAFGSGTTRSGLIRSAKRQVKGHDRTVKTGEGSFTVEEKIRHIVYPDDLLIETHHESKIDKSETPGWIQKPLTCDIFACGWYLSGHALFVPWVDLRRAWILNESAWKKKYPKKWSDNNNPDYWTCNIPVPEDVLREAIGPRLKIIRITVRS